MGATLKISSRKWKEISLTLWQERSFPVCWCLCQLSHSHNLIVKANC
uniref:Uncharacterized protein n=1 Tax=Anguilla anguilla TaxID=7936 RepID=A0A0E9QUR6_ANGAN